MGDDVHVYDIVGYQEGGYRSSNKIDRVTSFNDRQKYMTLYDQQAGPSEYQKPQQLLCSRGTRAAVNTSNDEVKGLSDCHTQKDELKQMKRCLYVLNLLAAILFLMIISSLGLVYII